MALLATAATSAVAAPPVLEALFPAGGQSGSSFTLAASGKLEADARLWIDCPGVHFVPNGKKREWQVTIEPGTPSGLYLVHAWNREGASAPRWFSIGSQPEMAETEPNDETGKGQVLAKLPLTLNGRLEKSGDVDGYTIKLAKDQTLLAVVEGYVLGSPVDIMAHVLDEKGIRILTASDGRNLDPAFHFKAPADGSYTVQLAGFSHPPQADVRFTGGATAVYRLHLSAGPAVTAVMPAVSARSAKSEIALSGIALDPKKSRHTVEATSRHAAGQIVTMTIPGAPLPVQLVVNEKPGLTEKEPNNERDQATPIQAGDALGGRLDEKDAADRFKLAAKKGEKFSLGVYSRRIGSRLDAVMEVLNHDGKSLLNLDDTGGTSDPSAEWTAPADGEFQIVVKDRFGNGGEDFNYVLQVLPSTPSVSATIADGKPVVLEAGKTVSLKVNVKPAGEFKEPLVVRVSDLPAGVFAADAPVPAKGGDVEIKIESAVNAEDHSGAVSISIWQKTAEGLRTVPANYLLRGENLRGTSLLDQSSRLWLTVRGK